MSVRLLLVLGVLAKAMSGQQEVVFSFLCPFFRVTGDSKAGRNTSVVCEIWACPGQTMELSLCEESVGDTFIRLFAGETELGSSDDSCGEFYGGSSLSYSFPYDNSTAEPCFSFDLYQGCFDPNMCYGTTHVDILGAGYGHPTSQPSAEPSSEPSSFPTSPSGEPSLQPSRQPTTQPTDQPSIVPSAQPSGEPTSPTGEPSGEPSGQPSGQPSGEPTAIPTSPSGEPSSIPSNQPTSGPTTEGFHLKCPFFDIVGDSRAKGNMTVPCDIWACPEQRIYMNLCGHSHGDTFIRLFDNETEEQFSDDGCGMRYGASKMMYYVDKPRGQPCGYYTLYQGCYDKVRCRGVTHIRVSGSGAPTSIPSGEPSSIPSSHPSSPSSQPSDQPSSQPSGEPSSPSGEPSSQPSSQPSLQPTSQPSSQPSARPSVDNSTYPPSFRPTPGPKPNMQITLIVAIGTPACVLVVAVMFLFIYRFLQQRYSVYLDVTSRVKCVSTLKFHDDLDELDLFEDGDFQDLCQMKP